MQEIDVRPRTDFVGCLGKFCRIISDTFLTAQFFDFRNRSSVIRGHETARHKRFLAFFSQPKKSLTTTHAKTQNGLWL